MKSTIISKIPLAILSIICAGACIIFIAATKGLVGRNVGQSRSPNTGNNVVVIQEDPIVLLPEDAVEGTALNMVNPIVVTKKNPYYTFTNPDINTVLMQFVVTYGDNEVYRCEGYRDPSGIANWNIWDTFKQSGIYEVNVIVLTKDIDTQMDCAVYNFPTTVVVR